MVVGAHLAGASVSRTTNLVGVSKTPVSRTTGREFVCRTPAKAFHVDCLVPTVKHEVGFMMVWGALPSCELEHFVVLRRMITCYHYRSILADHLHPMLQSLSLGERPVTGFYRDFH
ncbi:hypothetical protein TNCV_2039811 [Trichonephila clavipes]|nr:hypothetical protein TNCV_2039811 [Trichonephila clavipes]